MTLEISESRLLVCPREVGSRGYGACPLLCAHGWNKIQNTTRNEEQMMNLEMTGNHIRFMKTRRRLESSNAV